MQMNLEEFSRLFRTVGEVYGIYQDGELAGFYWVEPRETTLHLHGLILRPEFQGQGIGREVLSYLDEQYSERKVNWQPLVKSFLVTLRWEKG